MSSPDQPTLEFRNVTRTYRSALRPAVKDVSISVPQGEILALVGESGSGKTTLLRLAAGLETPDAGEILIDGRAVASRRDWLPAEKREVGFVFQDGALFPHLSVEKNVSYGLSKQSKDRRSAAVDYMLAMVGLNGFHSRFPHELSGGERQRLAVARALAPHPKILLLDEPFSNLDPALRRSLREEIQRILRKVNATAIMVTHDTEDALVVGDRVAIFRDGNIEQIGSSRELYQDPKNAYCARLFGPANEVKRDGSGAISWVRPEAMSLVCQKPDGEAVPVKIRRIADAGRHLEALVEAPAIEAGAAAELWTVHVPDDQSPKIGGNAWVTF